MIKMYTLEYLDSLILETFNSNKKDIKPISENDLLLVAENVFLESQKIQGQLKKEIFFLRKKSQIRLLVRKYHSTLVFLLDNVVENQKGDFFKSSYTSVIIDSIIDSLDSLLSFVENRFSNYLSLDERVPIKYLLVSRKEMVLKLERINEKQISNFLDTHVMIIVLDVLYNVLKFNKENKITYRQILYQKELLKNLEEINCTDEDLSVFTSLDRMLIGLNFNYCSYVNCLIERINVKLADTITLTAKISILLLYFKEFSQLQCSETKMFEPSQQNIKDVMTNWFAHEINYFEKKIGVSDRGGKESDTKDLDLSSTDQNKLECILSTDQMGLILRATDESRIVKAKSMTLVFKTIIPYLSTPFKKDLSYQSVRSKSYHAEERDKIIAIQTLEKIIKKIKTY